MRIYLDSGVNGPATALFNHLQNQEGSIVVDVVTTECIPLAVQAFAQVAETVRVKMGRDITVQPFGPREPLGFSVALSALPTLAEVPTTLTKVTPFTDARRLATFLADEVVKGRSPMVLEASGRGAVAQAMMGVATLRAKINWNDAEDDLYCSVLPVVKGEEPEAPLVGPDGRKWFVAHQYRIAVYPCAREKDNNPRVQHPRSEPRLPSAASPPR